MADPEDDPRYVNMINAANEAINALLSANEQNRIAVVAFSSEDYGRGTSGDAAANVLSDLAHYDGAAATAHLQRVNQYGQTDRSGTFVAGRSTVINATIKVQQGGGGQTSTRSYSGNAFRKAQEGGTNIQAGIALGASILMAEKTTTALVDDRTVTRLPFIIVLSDGNPTYSSTAEKWYDADSIGTAGQQGPGRNPYPGNGFLAAMTAAYYKGAITEHYFGNYANEDNHCNIYTVGVDLQSDMSASETALAEITLNPAEEYTRTNTWYNRFKDYWDSYNSGNAFEVNVGGREPAGRDYRYFDVFFDISKASITATKNYVNGKNKDGVSMYTGGLGYNDEYFATSGSSSGLKDTFKELVRLIQIKAISLPTDTSVSADFGGYVHFYDPIGEYMEVKDVHGIVADGYFFQGASFAKNMVNYGTGANDAFDTAITEALNGRLELSESGKLDETAIKAIVDAAKQADGQLYYNSNSDYENSFCWWGSSYTNQTTGDEHVQFLGFAGDDSIEYIKSANAPADADYVCRSYYYYGTAGGTIEPIDDFLLMVIRVQRSLVAPYQETVYVSIPGNLLSVDRVLITEDKTVSPSTWESFVQAENPVRIIYEVGLQSDINAQNVAQKLAGTAYVAEKTNKSVVGNSKDNYEASEDTYYFYTNDWDRSKSGENHERALAHAGFDVAEDNDFYAFLEDTLLYTNENGTPATTLTPGQTYYYERTYYDWAGERATTTEAGSLYACEEETAWIPVTAPSQDVINEFAAQNASGQWYVKAGTYTAYSLSAANDDTIKVDANDNPANNTGTSTIVAHPMRANAINDSHYVVYLGNNGRLALTADKTKTVQINAQATSPAYDEDGNLITTEVGELVTVDDVITYTIKVVNNEGATANAVVTDSVPYGTKLEEGSISFNANGTGATATNSIDANGNITWNIQNLPVNGMVYVSFKAEVTTDALSQEVITIDNQATIQIGNNPAYTTNKVENPPQGKLSQGTDGTVNPETLKVGDELTYRINYYNNEDTAATITITDIIPAGTTYMEGSATHSGTNSSNETFVISTVGGKTVLTWTLKDVQANTAGYVSFKVKVNESAKTPVENGATIAIGNNSYTTNSTSAEVLTGDLKLTKTVQGTGGDTDKEFTLVLTSMGAETDGYVGISGTFDATRNGVKTQNDVTFTNGVAEVVIKHGETLIIHGLPANLSLNVTEKVTVGYTPTYNGGQTVVIEASKVNDAAVGINVINTYAMQPTSYQLIGQKTLSTNGHYYAERTFTITSQTCDEEWNASPTVSAIATATVSSENPNGVFKFASRNFTAPGKYRYLIKEANTGFNGVTYDITQYRVLIDVVNNGEGALVATPYLYSWGTDGVWDDNDMVTPIATGDTVNNTHAINFENIYQPVEVSLKLEGNKVLTNRNLKAREFAFEVIENINGVDTVVSLGYNNADVNAGTASGIEFAPIIYTAIGEHSYTIREINGGLANVNYSTSTFNVTVSVTDTNNDGILEAKATYPNGGVVFTNTYNPGNAQITPTGTKTLTGRDMVADEFVFEVKDVSGNIVSVGHNVDGTNGSPAEIKFTPITIKYDAKKSYPYTIEYTVSEAIPTGAAKDPYMGYDSNIFTYKVVVDYNANTGSLTATADTNNPSIEFVNTQHPSSIKVTPKGTKITRNSQNLEDARFSFSVINNETGKVVYSGIAPAVESATEPNIEFTSLSYSHAGTYQYRIVESNTAANNGITYDSTVYRMEVIITHVNGELRKQVKYYSLNSEVDANKSFEERYSIELGENVYPSFDNTYAAKGFLNISATKELTGGRTLNADEFAFKLQRLDANGQVIEGREVEGLNKANGTIQFASLYYSNADLTDEGNKTGTVKYKMSEVIPTKNPLPGITYDKSEYIITISLQDDTAGKIVATVTSIEKITDPDGQKIEPAKKLENGSVATFTNSYQATAPVNVDIEATKVLYGKALNIDEFTFELFNVTYDTAGNITSENLVAFTKNQANGNIKFTRTYHPEVLNLESGGSVTYNYEIRELNEGKKGIDYDTDVIKVAVTVSDDGNGNLTTSKVYTYPTGKTGFVNTYSAEGTSIVPIAYKELVGRPMKDEEFLFEVKTYDVSTQTEGTVVSGGMSQLPAEGTNVGNIVFTPIGYKDIEGTGTATYWYTLSEVRGNLGGISYSNQKYYMKVVVSDLGEGELSTAVTYHESPDSEAIDISKVKFVNNYTTTEALVTLEANKILNGRDLQSEEFDFVVVDVNNTPVAYGDNVSGAKTGDEATIKFSTIAYNLSDLGGQNQKVFEYVMYEIAPPTNQNGIVFDRTKFKVKVTVKDNQDGTLSTTVVYCDENGQEILQDGNPVTPTFTNEYTSTLAEGVILTASKSLTNKQLKADEFKFELKEQGATSGQVKANDEYGIVTFDALDFDTAGTYFYELTEIVDASKVVKDGQGNVISGYTYDPTKYIVKVDVTDDLVGNLHATTTYYKESYDAQNPTHNVVAGLNFLNTYTPASLATDLTTSINATKTVTSPNGFELKADDFTFEIKDVYGNVVATSDNLVIDDTDKSTAKIEFSDFTFTQPGEYRYWISEVVDTTKEAYMTYDARNWEVHVTVSYAYNDILVENSSEVLYPAGTLYIAKDGVKTYASSRALDEEKPAFVNNYNPLPVTITITADKQLTVPEGSGRKLQAHEFTFRVKDEHGIIRAESQNDADGNITFSFTESVAGEHTYTVVEFVPAVNAGGIDYDRDTKAVIEVTVVDDGNGQLKIENAASITKENVAVFKNTYNPSPAPAIISAKKVLHNAELTANAFEFELVDANGKVAATATNDATGNITFAPQMFDKAGEYQYSIREVKGNIEHVTYDTTEFTVKVVVEDNLMGNLVANVEYQSEPVFENTYTPPTPNPGVPAEPDPEPGDEHKIHIFTKIWDDNNNAAGKRPSSIMVSLYCNGIYASDIELCEANNWTCGLILMSINDGEEVVWTIEEKNVPAGYTASYNQETHTVTNTYVGSVSANGTKTGDDSNLALFGIIAVVALIALAGIAVLLIKFKKKDEHEE